MSSREHIITIKNLRKYYPMGKAYPLGKRAFIKAVDGLNINIEKGEIFGLVGESGCGKSTTGHMLVNLLKPTTGEIIYKGRDIRSLSKTEQMKIREDIQIVFQDPFASLNPKKRIGWLLEEPLVIFKKGNAVERKRRVEETLEIVGLDTDYKNRYPHQLSGGQRQRVSIAIALMLRPKFIVLDEAVSALDVSIQSQILNLMKKLQREMDLTYLFISHDLNVVEYMSDRIGVMYMGKIVELGMTKDIYENPMHPYTQALFSSVPGVYRKNIDRIILKGDLPSLMEHNVGCPFNTRCFKAKDMCREKSPELKIMENGRLVSCLLY